jgi:rubrerythrin/plasmid maintenance system killer protein
MSKNDQITYTVKFSNDEDGFFGRECPEDSCKGYFKIEIGTGLKGEELPCHCPYCGHTGSHDTFWTPDQIELAKSAAMREFQGELDKMFKKAFKPTSSKKSLITFKYKPGRRIPLHRYSEKELETIVICSECGLRYAVYGVYAYCPDCGAHNSYQIFEANMELVRKSLDLATTIDDEALSSQLISDALENIVSYFDAYGREQLRIHASEANSDVSRMNCQNLNKLDDNLNSKFSIRLSTSLVGEEWSALNRGFQKRHVISHKGGVIDQQFIDSTSEPQSMLGHKVTLTTEEVHELSTIAQKAALGLKNALDSKIQPEDNN